MISKKIILISLLNVNIGIFAQTGNVGINTVNPGTTLDVNGAITNRETAIVISGNAVTIPANISQVQLTGAATATVTITAPAAPNAGQRLIVFNNTTGGFGATLNGVTIPNGKALEYVYSNSGWRSTDGGTVGVAGVNIYNTDGSLTSNRTVSQGTNTLSFTGSQVNAFSVDGSTLSVDAANNRIGIGTATPQRNLDINASALPIRVSNLGTATTGTNVLTIDNLGDVRNIPFNNLLAGPVSLLLVPAGTYNATGNESVLWCGIDGVTINLPIPSSSQIGKSISIVAAAPFNPVTITGSVPTVANATTLNSIAIGKRITIFAIAANTFGNLNNAWVVIAKDF
ncbi:hypothetical protein [Chryseobacterium sp. EZn1]|uniref:hypothetical protein n=1 Tax=Chryseobacterium cupriresistens TaxID=3366770 RepID=UPI003985048D